VLGSSSGGVGRHVAHLADILGRAGIRVDVAGPASALEIALPGASPAAVRPVEITDRPRWRDVAAVRALRAVFPAREVVHAHGLRAGALTVMAARSLPRRRRPRVVVTLHNLPVGGARVRFVSALLQRVVARGADVVLGVSGDLVDRARSRGARQVERALVPAPVASPGPPWTEETDRARLLTDLGLAADAEVDLLVTVARLAPQKGLELLLDTARLLAPRVGLRWLVAGEGPLEAALTARIARDGLPVRLLGRRSDVPELLAAADVVVQTSRWEGQPLVIQEALALGCVIVATDVGGTHEVTGDAAVLVPYGDPTVLATAISDLLDGPRNAPDRVSRALRRAAELPGTDDVLNQLLHVYALDGLGTHQRRVG
jgi:glycosyltransferase involved in cell wall biosynthesis